MLIFDNASTVRVPVRILLKAGWFDLFLDSPSAEERIVDDAMGFEVIKSRGDAHTAAYRARFLRRLGRVASWEGIAKPDGSAIAYDQAALLKILDRHPAAIDQLNIALNQLYSTDEADLQKSAEPPRGSSTVDPSNAALSTGTGTGSGSSNSANASA